jgi:hypothetical protein
MLGNNQMTLKDQAEFLAQALESGLKTVPEVIAWADENIMQLETPPHWLLELSLMGKAKGQDVVHVLREADGVADERQIPAVFFASVLENVGAGAMSVERVCQFLYPFRFRFSEFQRRAIQDFYGRYSITEAELDMGYPVMDPLDGIDQDFLAFLERESNLIP